MTRDDIIKLAREAKCVKAQYPMLPWRVAEEALEAFANLVAAAEREACAKLAREIGNATEFDDWALAKCGEIETAIRARGNT